MYFTLVSTYDHHFFLIQKVKIWHLTKDIHIPWSYMFSYRRESASM